MGGKQKKLILGFIAVAVFLVLFLVIGQNTKTPGDENTTLSLPENENFGNIEENTDATSAAKPDMQEKKESLKKPEEVTIDINKDYKAKISTTLGDIVIDLNEKDTPYTVNNFVYLSNNDFYDNTTFHRVVRGFMIQGGDPVGDGTGGPGYSFDDEDFEGEYLRGTVAMANSGPNTNGSQFFIMHADRTSLPKYYVIFGKVVEGIEVVDTIAEKEVEVWPLTGELSKPVEPVIIEDVQILSE